AGQAALLLDQCPPGRRDWEWHYLHRQCHRYLLRLTGPTQNIQDLAMSPDGRHLAVACGASHGRGKGEVLVWEARAGAPAVTYRGHAQTVFSVAFHPDGRQLASAGTEGDIHVWEWNRVPAPEKPAQVLRGQGALIGSLAYSPCGTWLASAGAGGRLCLWDIRTGQLRRQVAGHTGSGFMA